MCCQGCGFNTGVDLQCMNVFDVMILKLCMRKSLHDWSGSWFQHGCDPARLGSAASHWLGSHVEIGRVPCPKWSAVYCSCWPGLLVTVYLSIYLSVFLSLLVTRGLSVCQLFLLSAVCRLSAVFCWFFCCLHRIIIITKKFVFWVCFHAR